MISRRNRINEFLKTSSTNQLITHLRTPLFANGYALILSSATTAGLGLLYWAVAAHLYSTAIVGLNSAAISTMMFLGGVAQLNLATVLTRFIPKAGRSTGKLVASAYLISAAVALLIGIVFVVSVGTLSPSMKLFLTGPDINIWFVVATVCWAFFVLQDGVLTGFRRALWVPVENGGFAIVKIILLLVFIVSLPQIGVFASWTVGVAFAILPTNLYIFRNLLPSRMKSGAAAAFRPAQVARYVVGDYFGSLCWLAATTMLPLVVIEVAGVTANAYFYLCWTIGYSLYLISPNMGSSLIVEAVSDETKLALYSRQVFFQTLRIVVLLAGLVIVGAPIILRIFGENYSVEGSTLLRLLALSAIPNVVNALFISVTRAQGKSNVVFLVLALLCGSVFVTGYVFLVMYGISGIGLAWVVVQSIFAVILLMTQFRPLWKAHLAAPDDKSPRNISTISVENLRFLLFSGPPSFMQLVSTIVRKVMNFPALPWSSRNINRQYKIAAPILQGILPMLVTPDHMSPPATWTISQVVGAINDMSIVMVGPPGQPEEAVLKLARTPVAIHGLRHHSNMLKALHADNRLDGWRDLVPVPLAEGVSGEWHYVVEQAMSGYNAEHLLRDPVVGPRALMSAAATIKQLHEATASTLVVDETVFDRWVGQPLQILRRWNDRLPPGRRFDAAILRMEAQFNHVLLGRSLSASWVHGDYGCANVLTTPDGTQLTGIVDWELATIDDLPQLDPVQLLISSRIILQECEMGDVMVELLRGGSWLPYEQTILDSAWLTGDTFDLRTLLLFVWLRHIVANLTKSNRYVNNWFWQAKNIKTVLQNI